jgi:hypothetical protein
MELYERTISPKGKVTYVPVTLPEEKSCFDKGLDLNMTEGQLVSAIGGLAVIVLHGYQNMLPDHKLVHRKAQKVKDAVLELFSGTGQKIDDDTITFCCQAWDHTMKLLDGGAK